MFALDSAGRSTYELFTRYYKQIFVLFNCSATRKVNVAMQEDGIALQNSWQALATNGTGGVGRVARGRGGWRGGGRGGGLGGGASMPTSADAIAAFRTARGGRGGAQTLKAQAGEAPPTANTDSADAAQSWNTYQNRSNLQRARKEGGVRTLTVAEAVQEVEEMSRAVHVSNIGGRSSLWGKWCRRMEVTPCLRALLRVVRGGALVTVPLSRCRTREWTPTASMSTQTGMGRR
jgi:hypothetical protein